MSFKDFRVLETIGKGSFASVYKVSFIHAFFALYSTKLSTHAAFPTAMDLCVVWLLKKQHVIISRVISVA